MTTIKLYKSERFEGTCKVRFGVKHGRPKGRGHKAWRLGSVRTKVIKFR